MADTNVEGKAPFLVDPSGGDSANELTNLVQQMLQQMQGRFQDMSENIVKRIDEMGTRIDDLEKSIGDLVNEANDGSAPPAEAQQRGLR